MAKQHYTGELARLRLELTNDSPEENSALHLYGGVRYGHTITRDIIVPRDITLHALHYVIQQAFGWQNSHLHSYTIPDNHLSQLLSGGMSDWARLVGILFASPYMDEDAQFWDDDYESGSVKTWMRKKYTGPYLNGCEEERYVQSAEEMADFIGTYKDERYMVGYADGEVLICYDVSDEDSSYYKERGDQIEGYAAKETGFAELPWDALQWVTGEADPLRLLERLTVGEVLSLGGDMYTGCDQLLRAMDMRDYVYYAIHDTDPAARPVTDRLLYSYDIGDGWRVEITGSLNYDDLTEAGRVTRQDIDEAEAAVRGNYRPVCIAADGLPVMDDVGGLSGFMTFLEDINTDAKAGDKAEAGEMDREALLEWAGDRGWTKRKPTPKTLL